MTEPTRKDRELLKLRSARMSAVSIAGLMGRGWTEARVTRRLAEIDAFEAGDEPPVALPAGVDVADDRVEMPIEGWAQEHRHLLPVLHPARLMMTRATPWEEAALSFLEANPGVSVQTAPIRLPTPASKAEFFDLSWPVAEELCLETLPLPLVADEAETAPPAPDVEIDPRPEAGPVDAPAAPAASPGDEPPRPKARAPRRVRPAPVPMAVPAAAPSHRAPVQAGAVRLKRLTEKVVRWAGWFFAAGWDLYDIADLFDVDRDALEKVLT